MTLNARKTGKILKLSIQTILVVFTGFISFVLYETKDEIKADIHTIEAKLRSFHNQERLAGFAVSVFNANEVIYSHAFGFADVANGSPYTTSTLQYMASISKTTIGVSLLKAQELGLLKLDDPVNQHLPFKVFNPAFPKVAITIRHLANHTSSLTYNEKVVESLYIHEEEKDRSLSQIVANYFANGAFGDVSYSNNLPGTVWDYSNMGAGLAAYVVEVASGMSFADFTQRYIFEPLEMNTTHWFKSEIADNGNYSRYYEVGEDKKTSAAQTTGVKLYPARDMITNATDLTKYGQAILARNPKILSDRSFDEMLSPGLDGFVAQQTVDNHGIFWMIDRNQHGITYQLTGMNGGDNCIKTMMWLDLKTGLGYIFIGNTGPSEANRIHHILIYRALVSLGDHTLMNSPSSTTMAKLGYKWHNVYSRVMGLF